MPQYIYDAGGEPVAYIRGRYIHSMYGDAVGQLNGTHVHRLSGEYIGELHNGMVVDMHMGNFGNIGNPGNPGNAGRVAHPGRRAAANYGYPDVSSQLFG